MRIIDQELLKNIASELIKKKLTIATAESCTGGLIAHTLTNMSGSSSYFDRGFITYSNESKIQLLNISEHLLKKYGAVSAEVAKAMAESARGIAHIDIGLATTGIAGPTGGTKEKPVGLVYIAIATKNQTEVKRYQFKGTRLENKQSTLNEALTLLSTQLL